MHIIEVKRKLCVSNGEIIVQKKIRNMIDYSDYFQLFDFLIKLNS